MIIARCAKNGALVQIDDRYAARGDDERRVADDQRRVAREILQKYAEDTQEEITA